MSLTLAFDVYGTLIDTHGLIPALTPLVGEAAPAFSRDWRARQLEYAFRRGLMRRYDTFERCTRDALEQTCRVYRIAPDAARLDALIDGYRRLPAFADVAPGLAALARAGHRLYAFSNGTAEAVETLLDHAGIRDRFSGVVSVEAVRAFKPDPAVYAHFLATTGARPEHAWLVSSNPFDIIGARATGMRAVWVRRDPEQPFDPWGDEPDRVVADLGELPEVFG
ncbi:haloacid dehalogenase type II [Marichromatium gracile]|uniref:(S)-2-haloacid dehalogenase n=1 Tax=Marichromatium gracile TaxID=1048 RepID=A0ABR5VHV5_MARGR|nr:haloacid dehalogenase type II [Marichromatium gracile]KXX65167.1 haloacid dehalogenase [Marichromatium gracile]